MLGQRGTSNEGLSVKLTCNPLPRPTCPAGTWTPRPSSSRSAGSACCSASPTPASAPDAEHRARPQRHPRCSGSAYTLLDTWFYRRAARLPGRLAAGRLRHGGPVHRPVVLLRERPRQPVPLLLLALAVCAAPCGTVGASPSPRSCCTASATRSCLPGRADPRTAQPFTLADDGRHPRLGDLGVAARSATLLKRVGDRLSAAERGPARAPGPAGRPGSTSGPASCRRRRPS